MIQELFRIGPFAISPFGPLLVAAFLAAYFQVRSGFKKLGIGDEEDASAILLAGGIGGILGAKIYYAILYRDLSLVLSRSGLVWYGGFILASILILVVIHRRRLPAWSAVDCCAVALALGYAVGRIGCFLVGDDYGVPTDLPWGVAYPEGLPATTAENLRTLFGVAVPADVPGSAVLKVHPTQLYETALAGIVWLVGRSRLGKLRAGSTALLVLALLACERFLVEILRAKDDRFFGGLTMAQIISLAIIVVVLVLAWRRRRSAAAGAPQAPVAS